MTDSPKTLVEALEQAAADLEEAGKIIAAATIRGMEMKGTAGLFTMAAQRIRATLHRYHASQEKPDAE